MAKQAQRDLVDVTNAEQPRSSKRKRAFTTRSDSETEEVSQLAKKFAITTLFWLRDDRQTFRTPIDEQYDHLQRFENLESKIQGQIRDLLEVLPAQYADMMGHDATWLSQTVSIYCNFFCFVDRTPKLNSSGVR